MYDSSQNWINWSADRCVVGWLAMLSNWSAFEIHYRSRVSTMKYKWAIHNFWTFTCVISQLTKDFTKKAIKVLKVGSQARRGNETIIFLPYQTVVGAISKPEKFVSLSACATLVMSQLWHRWVSLTSLQAEKKIPKRVKSTSTCFLSRDSRPLRREMFNRM